MVSHKEVFKSTITVESCRAATGNLFQTQTVTVYSESFTDMLDDLVQASITIFNRITDRMNRMNSNYDPKDDQWHILISYPDVAKKATTSIFKEDLRGLSYSHPKETILEGRIIDFKDIVRFTVLARHLRIAQMASHLLLARPEKSKIKTAPKKPLQEIDDASTVQEMTEYGFTGHDLLIMIMVAHDEGRINGGKIVRQKRSQILTSENKPKNKN